MEVISVRKRLFGSLEIGKKYRVQVLIPASLLRLGSYHNVLATPTRSVQVALDGLGRWRPTSE